jgi:hypothetical protein
VKYGSAGFNPYAYHAGCTFADNDTYVDTLANPLSAAAACTCPKALACPGASGDTCTDRLSMGGSAADYLECLATRTEDCPKLCTPDYASTGVCQIGRVLFGVPFADGLYRVESVRVCHLPFTG